MSTKHPCRISWLCGLVLIGLLAACGSTQPTGNGATPTSGTTPGATATLSGGHPPVLTPTTAPVPPTQTNCPATGTARASVLANLALGNHPTVVYALNQYGSTATPLSATLKRYDVTTGATTVIIQLPGEITFAQVSTDGQWILFDSLASNNGTTKIQLVRLDGQGLQTLYCDNAPASHISGTQQWSADQKHIVFSIIGGQEQTVYLLDTTNGQLQSELTATLVKSNGVIVRKWLDNTHIYLTNTQLDAPPSKIYILDTTKGANQPISSLPALVNQTFGDFDSSNDGAHLYVDYGYCGQGGCMPPGRITVQPATGGAETTILNSPKYDTLTVRAVAAGTLLVEIGNTSTFGQQVDESHNGLWKMNPDGGGLTQLYADPPQQVSGLNSSSQYPWSNVSRDGSLYVLQVSGAHATALLFGSLSGGSTTSIASVSNGPNLAIVGWTTM